VNFYLARNPDVAQAGVDPTVHYFDHGDFEGRKPNAIFDTNWYRSRYEIPPSSRAIDHYFYDGELNGNQPNPIFDPTFMRERLGLDRSISPLLHYLRSNVKEELPVSKIFHLRVYRDSNPDLEKVGDLIEHFTEHGHKEKRIFSYDYELREISNDRFQRPPKDVLTLGLSRYEVVPRPTVAAYRDQLEPLLTIEPDLAKLAVAGPDLHISRPSASNRMMQLFEELLSGISGPVTHIIAAPWLKMGGADLVTTNFYRWIRQTVDPSGRSTLLLFTATNEIEAANWLPDDAQIRFVPPRLSTDIDAAQCIAKLITALMPRAILNINSDLMWRTYRDYGKALSTFTDLYAGLFCFDYDVVGNKVGYARDYTRSCLPYLTRVYTDNNAFISEVGDFFGLTKRQRQKFKAIYQPAPTSSNRADPTTIVSRLIQRNQPNILWAGRFCRQKRVDLLRQICQLQQHSHFTVYGYDYEESPDVNILRQMHNVTMKGPYRSFSNLPVEDFDMFLYTSDFDGLPNVLIEACTSGLPIVSSNVGGISELLGGGAGVLVSANDPYAFSAAINRLVNSPETIKAMIHQSRQNLDRHSAQATLSAALEAPSFLGLQ